MAGKVVFSQPDSSELKLTVKEAQEYALQYNKMVISAKMGVEESKSALWETISAALPQMNSSASFNDNLKLMTTLIDGTFFGRPGEMVPLKFGTKYNSSASVQASLLLFNAPLYLGIETSKLAKKISEQSLEKSELDTKESVSTSYYLILVSEKSLQILESNVATSMKHSNQQELCFLPEWLNRQMWIK